MTKKAHLHSHVHESHAETEGALGANTEVLEQEEYTRLSVFILEPLRIRRERTDECAGVSMSG